MTDLKPRLAFALAGILVGILLATTLKPYDLRMTGARVYRVNRFTGAVHQVSSYGLHPLPVVATKNP